MTLPWDTIQNIKHRDTRIKVVGNQHGRQKSQPSHHSCSANWDPGDRQFQYQRRLVDCSFFYNQKKETHTQDISQNCYLAQRRKVHSLPNQVQQKSLQVTHTHTRKAPNCMSCKKSVRKLFVLFHLAFRDTTVTKNTVHIDAVPPGKNIKWLEWWARWNPLVWNLVWLNFVSPLHEPCLALNRSTPLFVSRKSIQLISEAYSPQQHTKDIYDAFQSLQIGNSQLCTHYGIILNHIVTNCSHVQGRAVPKAALKGSL